MNSPTQDSERMDFLKLEVSESIALYKQHQELFLRWITIYGAVIGAISVYLCKTELTPGAKRIIPVLTAVGSFVVAVGCIGMLHWINKLESRVQQICSEIGVAAPPFFGAKNLIFCMASVLAGAFIVSVFVLIWWDRIFK